MSWTYSNLKTAIQDYLESTETSFVSNIDNFITTTEERILKGVQLDVFKKNVTGTATPTSPYLASPGDFLAPFSLAVLDASSNYNYLLLKQVSFIRDFTPNASTTGTPKYYAEFDQNSFILAPTPAKEELNQIICCHKHQHGEGKEAEIRHKPATRFIM